jgi:hypothetical protein
MRDLANSVGQGLYITSETRTGCGCPTTRRTVLLGRGKRGAAPGVSRRQSHRVVVMDVSKGICRGVGVYMYIVTFLSYLFELRR